jgi:hypothetical protein
VQITKGLDECKGLRSFRNLCYIVKTFFGTLGKESEATISLDWIVLSKQWMPSTNARQTASSSQRVESVDPLLVFLPDDISCSTPEHKKNALAMYLAAAW